MDIATELKLSRELVTSAVFSKKENFLLNDRDGGLVV